MSAAKGGDNPIRRGDLDPLRAQIPQQFPGPLKIGSFGFNTGDGGQKLTQKLLLGGPHSLEKFQFHNPAKNHLFFLYQKVQQERGRAFTLAEIIHPY
jgi:hypothetical protein